MGQKHICLPDAKNKLLLNVCIDCLYEKNLCLRVQLYNNETCSKNLRKLCKTCALWQKVSNIQLQHHIKFFVTFMVEKAILFCLFSTVLPQR